LSYLHTIFSGFYGVALLFLKDPTLINKTETKMTYSIILLAVVTTAFAIKFRKNTILASGTVLVIMSLMIPACQKSDISNPPPLLERIEMPVRFECFAAKDYSSPEFMDVEVSLRIHLYVQLANGENTVLVDSLVDLEYLPSLPQREDPLIFEFEISGNYSPSVSLVYSICKNYNKGGIRQQHCINDWISKTQQVVVIPVSL